MRRSVAGTFALLIAATAIPGCNPGATAEPTIAPTVSASAAMPSAPSTQSPGALPSVPDLPAGMPVMSDAEPADALPADPGLIARWTVDAIGPDVYAFYLDALPTAGFAIQDEFPGGNVAVIRFSTPDGTTLDLSLVGEGDGNRTRIDLGLPEGP